MRPHGSVEVVPVDSFLLCVNPLKVDFMGFNLLIVFSRPTTGVYEGRVTVSESGRGSWVPVVGGTGERPDPGGS